MSLKEILELVPLPQRPQAENILQQFSQRHIDLMNDRYLFLNQFAEPHQIVFLGDSITEEFYLSEWFPTQKIYNRGISGNTSYDILARLEKHIFPLKPKKLFLLVGTNDLARPLTPNEPISAIADRIEQIYLNLKNQMPDCQIYFISVYPTNQTSDPKIDQIMCAGRENTKIQQLNYDIQQIAKKYQATYLDIYAHLLDSQNNLALNFTRDGLHLTQQGYQVVATQLSPFL